MRRPAVLAALALACAHRAPADLPGRSEGNEAQVVAFDDATLASWAEELVPLVEAHAGRRFPTPPAIGWLDAEAFRELATREARLLMDTVHRDTPPALRDALAEQQAALSLAGLFGKYGLFDGTTYVVRDALLAIAAEQGVDQAVDMGRLVLAHELAHALQATVADPTAVLPSLVDQEHFHAWAAVSEGGANTIAWGVAQQLELQDAFWSLAALQGWGPDGLVEPAAYPVWMRYGRGMQTLTEVRATQGTDAFWTWHAEPPIQTSMLFRPATYATTTPDRAIDLAALLRGSEQRLTRGDWLVANTRLGEYELRGDALRTGKEAELDAVLAHLIDAQHLSLTMPDRAADIRVLVFDTPDAAARYLGLLRAEQTIEAQQLAHQLGVPVEVSYEPAPGFPAETSLLRTQRTPAGGLVRETRTAWVLQGSDVVAVTAARFRPGLRLEATLREVCERLAAARAG